MVPVSAHHPFRLKGSVESHPVPVSMHVHERAVALNHHQRRFLSILRPRGSSDDAPSRSLSASSRRAPLRLQISSTRPASRGRLPRRHRQRPERARRFRRREHRIYRPRLARRTLRAPSPRRAPSRARLSVCPVQRARPLTRVSELLSPRWRLRVARRDERRQSEVCDGRRGDETTRRHIPRRLDWGPIVDARATTGETARRNRRERGGRPTDRIENAFERGW